MKDESNGLMTRRVAIVNKENKKAHACMHTHTQQKEKTPNNKAYQPNRTFSTGTQVEQDSKNLFHYKYVETEAEGCK